LEEGKKFDEVKECISLTGNNYASVACPNYKSGVGTETPTMLVCPSARPVDPEYNLAPGSQVPTNLAKGNYAACFGAGVWINPPNVPDGLSGMTSELPEDQRVGPPNKGVFEVVNLGTATGQAMLGSKQGTRMTAIQDGTTKTMLVSEVLGWRSAKDGRGAWMWNGMGGASFSAVIAPNSETIDSVRLCGAETSNEERRYMCEQSSGSDESATYAAARSRHMGGVNVGFADNHMEFIADTIDLHVWRALATRRGPDYWSAGTNPVPVWVEPDAQPGTY
jgi:prepilin-type processing-associated H-X9-DG protein